MQSEAVTSTVISPYVNQTRHATYVGSCSNFITSSDLKMTIHDSNYDAMKNHFLMTGKGRRPKVPAITLTNKVLAQLYYLKEDGNATWIEVTAWFLKLFPAQPVTRGRLEHRMLKVLTTAQHFQTGSNDHELQQYLANNVEFDELPGPLSSLNLTRKKLLSSPADYEPPIDFVMTNSILAALDIFKNRESLPNTFLCSWVQRLLNRPFTNAQIRTLRKKVSSSCKKIKMKLKSKNINIEDFLHQPAFEAMTVLPREQANKETSCTCSGKHKSVQNGLSKLKQNLKKAQEVIEKQAVQISLLKEERDSLMSLKKTESAGATHKFQKEIKDIKTKNKELIIQLSNVKSSKIYKRNYYLRKQNKYLNHRNIVLEKDILFFQSEKGTLKGTLKEITNNLKSKVKVEKTMKDIFKKRLEKEKSTNTSLLEIVNEDQKEIKLKVEKHNQFSDNVRLTYMALQGEANVSASNCSKVVQIVSRHMFDQHFTLTDLPSASTVLNFADEAHHLAKHHIVEAIAESEHFTFATDGTSRQKRHFVERHITLANGMPMSIGFTEVASEDAETLLEITVDMFKELCDVYCSSESKDIDQLLKEIIKKMKCLMSDRAAVMKCYDRKLAEFKDSLLKGEDMSAHFLFCNAHFLLGLSKATEAALKDIEEGLLGDGEEALGRDASGAFSRFSTSSENATCRLIRTAADVLGPRGDERNGCREEWLAYCSSFGKRSIFTSFRSNRFNNLFENASAVLCHRDDILNFLNNHVSHSDLKLQSIIADLQDVRILSLVAAMALFHANFTGPYWQLMNSSTSYGQFPQYVQEMKTALDAWCSPEFELSDTSSVFRDCFLVSSESVWLFINSLNDDEKQGVCFSFKEISKHCNDIFKRQVADFLEGGPFSGHIDEAVKKILDTCPITNLIGERMFGDFDFDIHKRRNASTHLRSTLNMWKHNKTALWLKKQSFVKTRKLLAAARKHRLEWKTRTKESERAVKEKIKQRITDNNRRKKEKDIKNAEKKLELCNTIISQGGLCTTKEDVDTIFKGRNALRNLKAQLRYRKLILNKDIKLSGNIKELYFGLLKHLGFEASLPPRRERVRHDHYPPV